MSVDANLAAVLGVEKLVNKAKANGYCDLDENVLVRLARLPTTLTGKDADTVDTKHAADFLWLTGGTMSGQINYNNLYFNMGYQTGIQALDIDATGIPKELNFFDSLNPASGNNNINLTKLSQPSLFASKINSFDIGNQWTDLGTISATSFRAIEYCGNGIILAGDSNGYIWRSVDYGLTWVAITLFSANAVATITYLGNGIVIAGFYNNNLWRSTDFGLTWIASTIGVGIYTTAYCGNGIAIAGDGSKHVWRSTDSGATWSDLGLITESSINSMCYLDNGIVLLTTNSHVWRSTNRGANWTDIGSGGDIPYLNNVLIYCGNGIVIGGGTGAIIQIFKSIDYGLTWLAINTGSGIRHGAYLGNGTIILISTLGHIWRSINFGRNWTDSGAISTNDGYITYCGNGIVIFADTRTGGHIIRSDVTLKKEEFIPQKLINNHAAITASIHNFDASGNAPAQIHNNTRHNATYITSADTSFFRRFFQNEGTAVQGTWVWTTSASQSNYATMRAEAAGIYNNSSIINLDEYKWSGLYLSPGLYEIDIVYSKGSNRGIAQVLYGTTSLGTFDQYNATTSWNNTVAIQFSILSATTADLRFRVNGKNASSGGYYINFSRFEMFKYG